MLGSGGAQIHIAMSRTCQRSWIGGQYLCGPWQQEDFAEYEGESIINSSISRVGILYSTEDPASLACWQSRTKFLERRRGREVYPGSTNSHLAPTTKAPQQERVVSKARPRPVWLYALRNSTERQGCSSETRS
jgi:hypothetical protein